MKVSDLVFLPHHRGDVSPGKTHAKAILENGSHVSVVYTPIEPFGPNGEPYEALSILSGEDGDGITYAKNLDDLQGLLDEASRA